MDTVDLSLKSTVRKREPKCTLCNNHGRQVSLKGHKLYCPFASCPCISCKLTKTRRKVMAKNVALRRFMELDEVKRENNDQDLYQTSKRTLQEDYPRNDIITSEIYPKDMNNIPVIPLPNLTHEFDYYKQTLDEFRKEVSNCGITTSDLICLTIRSLLRSNDFNVENTFGFIEKVSKQIQLSQEFNRISQNQDNC